MDSAYKLDTSKLRRAKLLTNRTTLAAFLVVTATAISSLAVISHAEKRAVPAPVSNSPDASPVAPAQAQPDQASTGSGTVFVGSIVTTYNGNRFEVTKDGTLAPLAD
ncbi:MAG: hypothetical protein P4L70_07045 [Parasulfuritortus sp.]|nr:hypothetical protein [Parasulfuritortus sp.]